MDRRRSKGTASDTGERLLAAAMAEFAERGFAGTDSNRIARRAGFAPQTFYRWYRDKSAIFIAVYQDWAESERRQLAPLIAEGAPAATLARTLVAHHRAHRLFRRSLRLLALENDEVRRARADSRHRQIETLQALAPGTTREKATLALLTIERLADAIAEEEFADLGLADDAALTAIADVLAPLLPRRETR